jgi:DNA-binding CsgD family transcriptional regulator
VTGSALLGRDTELATVSAFVDSVPGGSAGLVSVRGEAGIGKSSLVSTVTGRLADSGFTVMQASLSEVESTLGWAGLRLLCRSVGDAELDALPPGERDAIQAVTGRSGGADVDPTLVAFALADVLERRLELGPVAIVVDDLHWLDAPTASSLAFAIRSNADRPLLTVIAHRPVDLPIEPGRLLDDDRHLTVELAGISVAGVNRLLRERLDVALDRSDVLRVHATTGGSPLHVLEIGRLLRRGVGVDDALVHPSAYDLILARVETLPLSTRAALLAAALAARPTLARLASALPDTDVESELEAAVKQQLIEIRGGAIVFTHPLARSATAAEAGATARRSMQRLLAATTEDDDERIDLLVSATERPDSALAAEIDAATERAAGRGDIPVALRLARRAAELTPPDLPGDKAERLLVAADLAASGGDGITPVELAAGAVELDPDIEVVFRAGVITALALGNRGDEMAGIAVLDELLPRFDGHPAKRARLHDIQAQSHLRRDVPAALASARAALHEAVAGGDPEQIDREGALVGMVSVLAGEPVDLDAIEATAARLPDTSVAKDWCADALSFCDRSRVALAISESQLGKYQQLGLVHFEAPVRSRMVGDLIGLGRYADAIRHANDWIDLQSLVGGVPATSIRADVAFARVMLGDTERGLAEYAAAEQESTVPIDIVAVTSRGGQIGSALGDWSAVVARVERARAAATAICYGGIGCAPFRVEGVEALVQLGHAAAAAELGAEHAALARRSGEPRGAADIARIDAALAAAAGDTALAADRWLIAIDGYERIELPYDHGVSLLGLGSVLRRAGKRAEAKRWLDAADAVFAELGAVPYRARVAAEFDRMGSKRGAAANELTPTERQVADLVAAGLSNAEIASTMMVSVRTVESNLTRAYRKLGVRRRTELAAVLRSA